MLAELCIMFVMKHPSWTINQHTFDYKMILVLHYSDLFFCIKAAYLIHNYMKHSYQVKWVASGLTSHQQLKIGLKAPLLYQHEKFYHEVSLASFSL